MRKSRTLITMMIISKVFGPYVDGGYGGVSGVD